MEIDESNINKVKNEGYRPCAMAALIYNKKIALFNTKKYPGYYLLQGGIEPFEMPIEAIEREVVEELGYSFYSKCKFPPNLSKYLFEDNMESKNIKDRILLSSGESMKARGKHYFVYALDISSGGDIPTISPADYSFVGTSVEYQQCKWCGADDARRLLSTNTNLVKRAMSLRAVDEIVKEHLLV